MEKVDVIIIGGGIAAACIADLLSDDHIKIKTGLVIKAENIHTASFHNQTWLQSGALYDVHDEAAKLCAVQRLKMMTRFNIEQDENAIFAYKDYESAASRINFLKQNGWENDASFISEKEASQLLGHDFYNKGPHSNGSFFIKTPDQKFDEKFVIQSSFHRAYIQKGCKFKLIETQTGAILEPDNNSPTGFVVIAKGKRYTSNHTFLATGVGTLKLLKQLGVDSELKLKATKSLLLRVPDIFDTSLTLFADRTHNLSVVKQTDNNRKPIYLLGNGKRFKDIDLYDHFESGSLTQTEKISFMKGFKDYPVIQQKIQPYIENIENYSVCAKVERNNDGSEKFDYTPICQSFNEKYKGLFAIISGKATLANYVAEMALNLTGLTGRSKKGRILKEFNSTDIPDVILWYEKIKQI